MNIYEIDSLSEIDYGKWCDKNDIIEETLYNTTRHLRGSKVVDLGIKPIPKADLACLRDSESGQDIYTLQGWLKKIRNNCAPS